MTKTTLELVAGDVVRHGKIIRTVARVTPNGYLNYRNQPLYTVYYVEGDTPEWGPGNSGAQGSVWQIVCPDCEGSGVVPSASGWTDVPCLCVEVPA